MPTAAGSPTRCAAISRRSPGSSMTDFRLLAGAYGGHARLAVLLDPPRGDELPQFLPPTSELRGRPDPRRTGRAGEGHEWRVRRCGCAAADAEALTHVAPEQWAFLRPHLASERAAPGTELERAADLEGAHRRQRAAAARVPRRPDPVAAVAPSSRATFVRCPTPSCRARCRAQRPHPRANCANCCAPRLRRGRPAQAAALLRDWIGTGLITATG